MKLLNKILPISTVLAATAITTPLVSCSAGKMSVDINILNQGQYARKTSVKEPTKFLSVIEATKTYLKDVKKDPQIFIDDYFESYEYWHGIISPEFDSETMEGEMTIKVNNVDPENMRISFEISGAVKTTTFDEDDESIVLDEEHREASLKLEDFKVVAYCDEVQSNNIWRILPAYISTTYIPWESEGYDPMTDFDLWLLHEDRNWSASATVRNWSNFDPESPKDEVYNYSYNYKVVEDTTQRENVLDTLTVLYCFSNYLSNTFVEYTIN